MNTIFQKGDIVYHYQYGRGAIVAFYDTAETYKLKVEFQVITHTFTIDGRLHKADKPTLSFKPYDLVNGGFSQERPIQLADEGCVGKICKFWDNNTSSKYSQDKPFIGILSNYLPNGFNKFKYSTVFMAETSYFENAQVLTQEEFNQINAKA